MDAILDYEKIRDRLQCCDMLVCDHKRLLWRYVGHTASVYVSDAGQVMVLESTLMGYTGVNGVQLHPMGEWLDRYPGEVRLRRLLYEGMPYRDYAPTLRTRIALRQAAFIRNHRGTSYPNLKTRSGRLKLALARLDFELFGHDLLAYRGKDDGIFCTHLKAMEGQACGYLRDDFDAKEAEPRNTRQHSMSWTFDDRMMYDWTFGPERRIK